MTENVFSTFQIATDLTLRTTNPTKYHHCPHLDREETGAEGGSGPS